MLTMGMEFYLYTCILYILFNYFYFYSHILNVNEKYNARIFFLLTKIASTYIPKKSPSLNISLQNIKYTNLIKTIIN